MDTQVGFINKLDVATFRAKLNDVETELNGNTPLLVFDNHDNPRLDARYGDGVHDTDIERVISTMLFASRGAALFYYGDEIGMKTTPPTRKEDVKDPVGLTGWPKDKGRDGERTPMQWNSGQERRVHQGRRHALAARSANLRHSQRQGGRGPARLAASPGTRP
jgi:alpha-glucosidase